MITHQHWSKIKERGSGLGLRIVFLCYKLLGKRVANLLLYPVVGYFFLTGTKARSASAIYLARIQSQNSKPYTPRKRDSFNHMMAFAKSGLDKLAAWSGRFNEHVDFPNQEGFEHLLASGKGAVLIASHLGSIEMTRALANNKQRAKVNAVVYTDHAQNFNRMLQLAHADFGINLIQISHFGPDTAIMLKEKIDQGELIVIVGDRTPPAETGRITKVDFLGHPADFAQGPFILASLLDCPVYLFFCLRENGLYRIYLEPFANRIKLPRNNRQKSLHQYMQQYAKRLEFYCFKAPTQWFNFYNFWQ